MTSSYEYVVGHACPRCRRPIGAGTGLPRLDCSRCGGSYCSVECQKLDWKDHKAYCKIQAEQSYKTEAAALSQRIRLRVKANLKRFTDASVASLAPFLAGLFGIGLGTADKSETHLLHLELDYSPEEATLSRRLSLRRVSFWLRTDVIAAQSVPRNRSIFEYLLGSDLETAKGSNTRSTPDDHSYRPVLWEVLFDRKDTPPVIMGHNTQCLLIPYPIQHMPYVYPTLVVDDGLVAALRTAFEQLDLE